MQAVRNAEIEIAMGAAPEVKVVAQKILTEQKKEIATMQGFLKTFGASEKEAPADQQAVWDKNTADLRAAATPQARDVVFLTNMVPHLSGSPDGAAGHHPGQVPAGAGAGHADQDHPARGDRRDEHADPGPDLTSCLHQLHHRGAKVDDITALTGWSTTAIRKALRAQPTTTHDDTPPPPPGTATADDAHTDVIEGSVT